MNISYLILLAVFLNGEEIAYSMSTATGYNHSLCTTLHILKRHLTELLHHDGCFLVDGVLVIIMESLQSNSCRCFLVIWIVLTLTCNLITDLVSSIVFQNILDEAFLYCLEHRVVVVSLVSWFTISCIRYFNTESLECLWLRSSSESIEREISMLSLAQQVEHQSILFCLQFLYRLILPFSHFLQCLLCICKSSLQFLGTLSGLA